VLPAEAKTEESTPAKVMPQPGFCIRLLSAQVPGE